MGDGVVGSGSRELGGGGSGELVSGLSVWGAGLDEQAHKRLTVSRAMANRQDRPTLEFMNIDFSR